MPSKLFAVLLISCIFSLYAVAADAKTEVSPPSKEGPVLTNEDLEKYKKPSDDNAQGTKTHKTELKKEKTGKAGDQQDKAYWCNRAKYYRKKIEKAQDEIDKQGERIEKLNDTASMEIGKRRKALEKDIKKAHKKLKDAQKELKDRQKDLERIEDEAHKKGVPPGWLRCQFTW